MRTLWLKSEIVCNWCSFLCHLASSYVQTLPEESTWTWMGPKQEKSAWHNPCHTSHHHRTIPVPIIQIRWHSCKTTLEALGGRTLTPLARPIPSKQLPERPEGDFFKKKNSRKQIEQTCWILWLSDSGPDQKVCSPKHLFAAHFYVGVEWFRGHMPEQQTEKYQRTCGTTHSDEASGSSTIWTA